MSDDFTKTVSFLDPEVPTSPFGDATDSLPTHPEASAPATLMSDIFAKNDLVAKYRMFDLSKQDHVLDLEEIMTDILYQKKILRQEKWAHDKEGLTVVTVAWIDKIPKSTGPKGVDSPEELAETKAPADLSGGM